jgi:hypothetical protein
MKSTMTLEKSIFILDGARGTYIPQNLAEIMLNERHLHTYEFTTDSATLKRMLDELIEGQDNEYYWDNWNDILCYYNEIRKMSSNELFYLTQGEDGDLWLIHEDELEEWNEYDSEEAIDSDAFTLVVDLDERGEYKCHVENCDEDVVWECGTEDAMSLVDDGFLPCVPHECVEDVLEYLQSHNVLGENAKLTYNN